MISTLLALAAAVAWGVGDFLGGLMSRRLPTTTVMVVSQGFGLVVVGVACLATGTTVPVGDAALYALGAGATGAIGLAAFYRALATGMVSLVAPVAATGVMVPVAVGMWSGEVIGTVGIAGIGAAIGGVILASIAPTAAEGAPSAPVDHVRSIGLAIVAAVLFGAYFPLFAKASADGLLAATLLQRITSLATVTGMWVIARRGRASASEAVGSARILATSTIAGLIGAGTLDIGANILYGGASMSDLLSIAAVLSSLYPVVTVLMARIFLGERLAGVQGAGVVLALTGTTLIAAR